MRRAVLALAVVAVSLLLAVTVDHVLGPRVAAKDARLVARVVYQGEARRGWETAATPAATPPSTTEAPPIDDRGAAFRSLRGTEVDGALEADATGRFVATREAVRLFDYFLSAQGDATLEEIRARVAAVAEGRLAAPEVARAIDLFDRYVAYRQGGRAERTALDLRSQLAAAHAARIAAFGEGDAASMFGDDEAIVRATLDAAEAHRAELSPEERARRVAAAEDALPADVREMHARREAEGRRIAERVAQRPR